MNMNQVIEANSNPESSGKRKRGRPRKYPKMSPDDGSRIPRTPRTARWEESNGPPGFAGGPSPSPRPAAGPTGGGGGADVAAEAVVGRAVSGVIEAVFDAGYLLNVRVANSDTTLRGVVFRPGRFVPVSSENDVAPNVQMIRRAEIPVPADQYVPRPRERKEQQVQVQVQQVNSLFPKGLSVSPAPGIPRANLVPVVLEPSKSVLPVATEPNPLAKGKQPQDEAVITANPPNGSVSSSTTQVPAFSHQLQVSEISSRKENGQPTESGSGAKPPNPAAMPFENLVTEVIKRIETPTEARRIEEADTLAANNDGGSETNEVDRALDVEPLRVVMINEAKPMEVDRTSKMSQLLEVLQGNMSDSPAAQAVVTEQEEGTMSTRASLF